ncbi:MAG: 2,3-bisphosphoglycerate-independent phosphoglycerate mutase [Candidatus Woesearchaeota archaeon]
MKDKKINNKSDKKVLLVIRDGWGYRKSTKLNALKSTKLNFTNYLMKNYPNTLIHASGEYVGLPKGYQGNSEVGHMTIGSGRIINQSLLRINKSIENKSFFKNAAFVAAVNNCKKNKSTLHIMGLAQIEGVHSHITHLYALLELCKKMKFYDVKIHLFTDGRDSPVNNAKKRVKEVESFLKKNKFGEIVSITGRYYAMDRDRRWDRIKLAYDAIVDGNCKEKFNNSLKCLESSYKRNETDEFLKPKIKENYTGMKDKDSVIFFNFRTDRTRQLTKALVEKSFNEFKRKQKKLFYVAMTNYYKDLNGKVAFDDVKIKNNLGEVIAKNNLTQFRISETEKYAHVTFFFNSQVEKPNKNEDRFLIHSPKVATYDLKPEMSVKEIADNLVKVMKNKNYNLIVTNLVNGDMVGHTGITSAIKKAIIAVDKQLKRIIEQALKSNYDCLIFADHGNVEDQTKKWKTSHTTNLVPFIYVTNKLKDKKDFKLKKNSSLQDIAPTALKLLGIKKPKEMTGNSIILN